MLNSFRSMAQGFVAKLLIVALALSLALWGIGDIFRTGSNDITVATVGDETINQAELDAVINQLQRQYSQITAEVAGDPSFQFELVNNLVNDRLMRLEAKRLGLEFGDETLIRITAKNPLFQNKSGAFDRNLFITTLQRNNHSERSFLEKMGEQLADDMLRETFIDGILPSASMLELTYKIRNESREARLIFFSEENLETIDTPPAERLEAFYREQSERYMRPEMRVFKTISFDANRLAELLGIKPTDEALARAYDAQAKSYQQPEEREVSQLTFKTEAEAKTFAMDEKTNFTKLGWTTASDLPPEVSTRVFALKEDELSEPIQTSFGWSRFRVSGIRASRQKSFDEVRAQLEQELAAEEVASAISDVSVNLEDTLAGGATLEEALGKVGLGAMKPAELGPVSATYTDPKGESPRFSALEEEMISQGFALDEGEVSMLSLSKDNHYYLVQLERIEPEGMRPYDEVQSDVLTRFMAKARAEQLEALANETAGRLQEAENLKAEIEDSQLMTIESGPLKRTQDTITAQGALKDKILTSGFITELFSLPKGGVTRAYPLPSGEYVVGILDKISPAPPVDAVDLIGVRAEIAATLPEEIYQHYINYLRRHYKVTIDTERLFGSRDQVDGEEQSAPAEPAPTEFAPAPQPATEQPAKP